MRFIEATVEYQGFWGSFADLIWWFLWAFIFVSYLFALFAIIGDLFVSRQGEGMFAPTYSVRGTFARARIALNPVAALTPGVLRQIFENPSVPPPGAEEPAKAQAGNR